MSDSSLYFKYGMILKLWDDWSYGCVFLRLPIFEYLWFHIFSIFYCGVSVFWVLFWIFGLNDYLNFDHIRLKIVFSVPFKVKMSFPRPFYFDFSIFGLSLRFFQYLVAFLATNSSDCQYIPYLKKNMALYYKTKALMKILFFTGDTNSSGIVASKVPRDLLASS